MIEYHSQALFALALISFLGALSPGPTLIAICHNTLCFGRKSGVYTALGVSLGIILHISYSLYGLQLLAEHAIGVLRWIRYIGCAYLLWLGYHALIHPAPSLTVQKIDSIPSMRHFAKQGLFVDLFNPQNSLFFISLFSQVIEPNLPLATLFTMSSLLVMIPLTWFICLIWLLSLNRIQTVMSDNLGMIRKLMGISLIGFATKIMFFTEEIQLLT